MNQKFILFNGKQTECNEKTTLNELFESIETREGDFGDYFWQITGDLDDLPEKPKKNLKLGALKSFKQNGQKFEISCTTQKSQKSPLKRNSAEQPTQVSSRMSSKGGQLRPVAFNNIQTAFIPPTEQFESNIQYNVIQPFKPKIEQQNPKFTRKRKFQKSQTTPSSMNRILKDFEITIRDDGSVVEVSKLNGEFYLILREDNANEFEQQTAKDVYDKVIKLTEGPNLVSVAQTSNKNVQTQVCFCDNYKGLVVKWFSELYTIIFLSIN